MTWGGIVHLPDVQDSLKDDQEQSDRDADLLKLRYVICMTWGGMICELDGTLHWQ